MLLYPYRPPSTVCIHVTVYFVWHSPVYRVYSNTPCCYTLTVHPPQSVSMSQYTLYGTHLSTEYIRTLRVVIPLPSTLHSLYPCHSVLCMTLTCLQSILEHSMLLYPYRPSSQSVSMSQYTLYDTHLSADYIRTLRVVIPLPSILHSLYPCHSILCSVLTCLQSILEHSVLLYPYRPSSTVCIHVTVYFVVYSPVYRVY